MPLNFNVQPYWDDFDPSKNYHRILFKPGFAVQARELTQSQTILQNQISSFADNIFKQNSPVTGGQVTTNLGCFYIKLLDSFNGLATDVDIFLDKTIQDATGSIVAKVIAVAPTTGLTGVGDPNTLILSYKSGNQFTSNSLIFITGTGTPNQVSPDANSAGKSSTASISNGVFYLSRSYKNLEGTTITNGVFVKVNPQTIILSKYNNIPTVRVGLNITETIEDSVDDPSLLDPAIGASNYQAPGADRYTLKLSLETRPLTLGDDDGFIELLRIDNGRGSKILQDSVYNVIDDYFAKRDYETNGDYIVNDFALTPKTAADANTYTLGISKGLAYVHGYRVENTSAFDMASNRARTTSTQNNNPIFVDFGNYLHINSLAGANGSFFDTTTSQNIDFHCVSTANVNTLNANTYIATVIGSGYIRSIVYNNAVDETHANSFVYKAYFNDIQLNTLTANAISPTGNIVTFPGSYSAIDNAYNGVQISIVSGPGAGETRTVLSYVGSTRVATINKNWVTTPDANSVMSLIFTVGDAESLMSATKASYPATVIGSAAIDKASRTEGLTTGRPSTQNPTLPEMVFQIGNPYISTMAGTSYTTEMLWRNVSFTTGGGSISAILTYSGSYLDVIKHIGPPGTTLSNDLVKQNFVIVVTNKGINTKINVGDVIPWTTTANTSRSVTLDGTGEVATLSTATTDLVTFTGTILSKVFVTKADDTSNILKIKNLITGNTTAVNLAGTPVGGNTFVDDTAMTSMGQVYILKAGLVAPNQSQSLYLADVKNIVKIVDSKAPGTPVSAAMLSDSSFDITSSYKFDNGQRDSFYDHASISLVTGASQPLGNILVILNYYQHTGGDGYFNKMSYIDLATNKEDYRKIPVFLSSHGKKYVLRDSVDFRPSRVNASLNFAFRYAHPGDTTRVGTLLPVDLTTILSGQCSFFLGRKDLLILTKDKSFQIIEGAPNLYPVSPVGPEGSLLIANIRHDPYTSYLPAEAPVGTLSNLSIEKLQHKRFTMQDISSMEHRIGNLEYYTALNLLEQNAQSLQIPDVFGLNRFKNGILVDNFSSFSTADTANKNFNVSINGRTQEMTASQNINNFPLKSLAQAYNIGSLSPEAAASLNFSLGQDNIINYFSLPFTTKPSIIQRLASRVVNLNPFSTPTSKGHTSLSPNMDIWVDETFAPALVIIDPNLQVFQSSNTAHIISMGDWQTISGTSRTRLTSQTVSQQRRAGGWLNFPIVQDTTTQTFSTVTNTLQQQTNQLSTLGNIGNTYSLNNGYITDISILPWIRPQQIVIQSYGLLIKSTLHVFFDGANVDKYVRRANEVELTGVTGTFKENDILAEFTSGILSPVGRILGVYNYPSTSNTRLYVAGEANAISTYSTTKRIQNFRLTESGAYAGSTSGNGTITIVNHYGGRLAGANSTNSSLTLTLLSSNANGYYAGNTIYINAGSGVGQSANIVSYFGATRLAIVSPAITARAGDVYSMGSFKSDENGGFYGVFNVPGKSFNTGQRVLRVDNSINGNPGTETSSSEGTFFASGLSTQAQKLDFGTSPSGSSSTFFQTDSRITTTTDVTTSVSVSPWHFCSSFDPVAQTFMVSGDNFPNGCFLDSVDLFFRTKPTNDVSPVTLTIVGTLNGYPDGQTLDHSTVTTTPDKINVSETPHYLDATSITNFKFKVPVYIQPGILYAMILKSPSSDYNLWTASNGDDALSSSVKNQVSDPTPSVITKISTAPYVGALFLSQNSQTWTADQNQDLMFTVHTCIFDITKNPSIQFVVPNKLPRRALIEESVDYFINANSVSAITNSVSFTDLLSDAFNITSTDFMPTTTNIGYTYSATLSGGGVTAPVTFNPGKYGTTMFDNIFLNDGLGERKFVANANTSFSVFASLQSVDPAVSPFISDGGLSVYSIKWNINNCELSNNLINLISGGQGYNANLTSVTVSAPTGVNGVQAFASANIVGGVIKNIYFNPGSNGSGYITTPTITILDANTSPGTGANVVVTGETSRDDGPGLAKYLTKKVVMESSLVSGDLNVYMSAYRPVNTDILVYYKIFNQGDSGLFDDVSWQLMTMINASSSSYSQNREDIIELVFAPGTLGVSQGFVVYKSSNGQTYTDFSQFAIKVVLTSSDHTYTPFLKDLRAIALPANVNITV